MRPSNPRQRFLSGGAVSSLLACALLSAGCLPPPVPAPAPLPPPAAPSPLTQVPPSQWPDIQDDLDSDSLAKAAETTAAYLRGLGQKPIAVGDRSLGPQLLLEGTRALARIRRESKTPEELTARLKEEFDLFRVAGSTGGPGALPQGASSPERGPSPLAQGAFFSAYYQPVLKAGPVKSEAFPYPIYRRPPDLIEADLGAFRDKLKGEALVGRVGADNRFVPYFDRGDIDVRKALEGRGLEIAWLADQFDRLDLHVQGSGLLEFPDGAMKMARFAATNALPYRSVGLALAGSGAVKREDLNRERLVRYLHEHPEGESWLLSQNPRYTFFDLVDIPADGEPFGKIEQPLVAGRSIAVDPAFSPLGAAAFVRLPLVQTDASGALLGKARSSRLVFCQDTGGAIQGPGRVDLYVGHGPQAKALASQVWDAGELYLLIKKLPPRQR